MTEHIPLNKLILSPRNVRKTNGEEDIEGLADSIHSKGLLQNLVVSEGETGKIFEVDAGGRRLRALQLLVERKDLQRNFPVPCIIVPRDDAQEASLAENLQKIAMNPADEVEAFAAIVGLERRDNPDNDWEYVVDGDERVVNCARRFGRTENYIRQRLRLAALAPEILDALREGAITIEAAKAYATHPDHKVQLQVFNREAKTNPEYAHRPNTIRDALNGKIYPADHWLVRYVGLETYRAAGGRTEADLFFEEEERQQLLDPAIVDHLAREKAAAEAQAIAQKDGWLDAEIAPPGSGYWVEPKPPKGYERCRYGENPEQVAKKDRGECVVAFRLTDEGELAAVNNGVFFRPERNAEKQEQESRPAYDYEAIRRKEEIELRAARLAAPKIAGTPLEGKAYWPTSDYVSEDDNGNAILNLLITVPKAEVEAKLEEAERLYDDELAKEKADQEAAAAAREAETAEQTDGDTDTTEQQPEPAEATA